MVVKPSWCEDRRHEVEVDLLVKCEDDFGIPRHHHLFCPTDAQGRPMSTARFLPADDEELKDSHWAITTGPQVPSHGNSMYPSGMQCSVRVGYGYKCHDSLHANRVVDNAEKGILAKRS